MHKIFERHFTKEDKAYKNMKKYILNVISHRGTAS